MSRYWYCWNEEQFELLEGLSKKGLPWHGHQSRESGWQWWDVMWRWQGSLVLIEPKFKVIITIIITLIVWGRFLPVAIAITSCCWLAYQVCHCVVSELVVKKLRQQVHMKPKWQCIVHRWLTTISSFRPSFPHHRQKESPLCCCRAYGKWMPSKPIILGNSVGTTSLKKWMSLWDALVVLLAVELSPARQFLLHLMDFGT